MNQPEFMFFDLGKVLLSFDHEVAVQQLAELTEREPARIRDFVFRSSLQADYERGSVSTSQFCDQLRQHLSVAVPDPDICHAASDIFHVNAAIVPLIAALRSAGYPMGILSNTCDAHWSQIRQIGYQVIDLFDPFVLSYEVGASKPDPAIYKNAAQQVGTDASKIFFVDDLMANVAGAKDAGFDAVLFTSVPELVRDLRARGLRFNL